MSNLAAQVRAEMLRICREITQDLRSYPGAQLFNEPVNPEQLAIPNYYKKVKNPQDLGSILDRLNKEQYTDVKIWERDVNTVWANAELYNGKESYVAVIAQEMSRRFKKLKRRLDMKKLSGWMKALHGTQEKLDKLMGCPPSRVGPIFPVGPVTLVDQYAPFGSHELDCLVEASRVCFRPEDYTQITKILQSEAQIENCTDDFKVNVDELSSKSLHRLKDFFRKRIQQMGQVYPV
jgi:hypothetical protein